MVAAAISRIFELETEFKFQHDRYEMLYSEIFEPLLKI